MHLNLKTLFLAAAAAAALEVLEELRSYGEDEAPARLGVFTLPIVGSDDAALVYMSLAFHSQQDKTEARVVKAVCAWN